VDNGGANFEIPLSAGWNLVSVPLSLADTSAANVLASIAGSYDSVKYYNAQTPADPWKTYRPGGSANDLANIDRTMGVWIHANSACTLSVSGTVPASTAISLKAGWNLVGYPSQAQRAISVALAGTGCDRVEGFMAAPPYVQVLDGSYLMKSGEAYWVHVVVDAVWTVDW
jgi:hypothetical protein